MDSELAKGLRAAFSVTLYFHNFFKLNNTVSITPFSLLFNHHHAAYSSFDAPEGTHRLVCDVSSNYCYFERTGSIFGNPLDGHHDDDLLSHQQRALEHLQFSAKSFSARALLLPLPIRRSLWIVLTQIDSWQKRQQYVSRKSSIFSTNQDVRKPSSS